MSGSWQLTEKFAKMEERANLKIAFLGLVATILALIYIAVR
jgi:hypothetical protein